MTPQQREAALRLIDELSRPHCDLGQQEAAALLRELAAVPKSAIERFNETEGVDAMSPLERLRFFCSLSMTPQDWLDVEPFFDALAAEPQGEPVAWHVCSVNSDGSLSLEFAASWEESAHEHINDAINEYDIDGATSWVVRPVYASPQPQQTEPSQNPPPQQRRPPREQITAAAKALCRQASTACNVDFDDNWKVYGDDYIADATAALNAAYGIGEAP